MTNLTKTTYTIVIPIKRDSTQGNHQKGRAFERLVSDFLKYQSYAVVERLRDGGTEIDLLCKNKLRGDSIVVECKAHDRSLQSEVVNKLFSDVTVNDANGGWIFATGAIGSEARTRLEKLNRGRSDFLRFFSGNELVQLLLGTGALKAPGNLPKQRVSSEHLLCLHEDKRIWAVPLLDERNDRPVGCLAWNAETGEKITSNEAPEVADTDFPYADLPWLDLVENMSSASALSQPVIEVIPGDEWSDYRPSRPDDFVGRAALLAEIEAFFDDVVQRETPSRIFGIKGRSGWGKSSLAIKLAHDLSPRRHFILPVDCRSASSSIYGDLALARALNLAAKQLYHGPLFTPRMDFRTNPFEEASVSSFLRDIQAAKASVCVVFDQFEAIIHRTELRPVFERLRQLALFADEMRGPVVIGFSWKTDGTVGSDNPGYHLWHSLADRRRDFEVDRFTREDADQFIALAQRSAHTQLPKAVVQFILGQYAGYPWLLKKLVKHCLDDVIRAGSAANLNSIFNISALFDSDLQELNKSELSALKFIARESPVELHIAEDKCGAMPVTTLIDRRLITKTGSQISLYWDIFRDYVLNDQVPQLPNTYVPTLSVRKIRSVVRMITQTPVSSYEQVARTLGISMATADNAVRDLANFRLVEADRSTSTFSSFCSSPEDATAKIVEFLKSHAVFLRARQVIETGTDSMLARIDGLAWDDYSFLSIDRRTLRTYVRKILVYCLDFGLLEKRGNVFSPGAPVRNILDAPRRAAPLLEDDVFRGAAPPTRVLDLLRVMRDGHCRTLEDAAARKLRNAVYAASRLGLIEHRNGRIRANSAIEFGEDLPLLVASAARNVEPMQSLLGNINVDEMTGDEVGTYLSDLLELNWSPASCRRYGFSLREWCLWVDEQLKETGQPTEVKEGAV